MTKKMLLVVNEPNKNVYLSSRNLPDSKVLIYSELNTYEILNADVLVFTKAAIDNFQGKN